MLTTVGGVYKTEGKKRTRVPYFESITRSALALASGKGSELSTGGMASKLRAAQMAARAGAAVVIADGRKAGTITRIMAGEDVGTFILPSV
jgi:glutamate 5-kinase